MPAPSLCKHSTKSLVYAMMLAPMLEPGRMLDLYPFSIADSSRLRPAELTLFKALAEQAQTCTVKPDYLEQSARLVDK